MNTYVINLFKPIGFNILIISIWVKMRFFLYSDEGQIKPTGQLSFLAHRYRRRTVEGLGFDYRAGQFGRNTANRALSRGDGPRYSLHASA